MSPTGDGTDSSTSLEQRRANAVPSLLSCFKYKYGNGNLSVTSRSTVKRSTDFPWSIKKTPVKAKQTTTCQMLA